MTLPPEDRDLIERVLGVSAFNAPHTMYSFEDVEALLAAARAEAAPVVDEGMVRRAVDAFSDSRDAGEYLPEAMRAALEAALNHSREM